MDFTPVDGYLLDGTPSKREAIDHVLRERVDDPRAAPFYRAFEAIGTRAADEALIAIRALVAGKVPDDELIRRLRDLVRTARAGKRGDAAVEAAREAYTKELGS
ncbi:MAG: hypothetical protein JO359_08410 [Candidatus Eremiobacteraeota bacterium]|nr:hypothetical protein [Candidatus Eremiobacteraeota bacterium]